MSSTPSTSNMAPVPVIVPMDINTKSDRKIERREQAEAEEVDRVTAAAQKKWDDTKVEWERCQKEKAEAIAVKEEAVWKAAEEAVEAAHM